MDQNEALNSINSDLIRGHIDTIILKALQAGDRYGYDIIKEIEHKSDGQYVIKQPTLYSCLKRLEVQGFVKSYWGSKSIGGRKKYFTLTDKGRELFVRNKIDWDYSRTVIDKLISDENYSYVPISQKSDVQNTDGQTEELLNLDIAQPDEEQEADENSNFAVDDLDEDEFEQSDIIDVLPLEVEDDDDVDTDDEARIADDGDDLDEAELAMVEPYKNDYDLDEEYDRRMAEAEAARSDDEDEDDEVRIADDGDDLDEVELAMVEPYKNDYDLDEEYDRRLAEAEAARSDDEDEDEVTFAFYEEEQPAAGEPTAVEEPTLEEPVEEIEEHISEAEPAHEEPVQNEIINGDEYQSDEELPLLTSEQDIVESFASESESDEEEVLPDFTEEPDEVQEELPLSASELNMADGLPSNSEEEHGEIINSAYYEQRQESYLDNVDNTEYEPPRGNDAIDINNYFADFEEESDEMDEVASSEAFQYEAPPEPIITPPLIELSKPEFPEVRRFVRETPPENKSDKTLFYSYKRSDISLDERSAIIDKEYRSVIKKLISDNIIEYVPPVQNANEPIKYNEVWLTDDEPPARPPTLKEIQEEEPRQIQIPEQIPEAEVISEKITAETGDNVELRTHSNKDLREYNSKHYYYSNQLRLLQYGILFGIMLLEIALCFYFIEVVHNKMNINNMSLAAYIIAVVVAAIFPIIAFFMSSLNYNKRKRINYNGKTSAVFAIIVTVLLMLIVIFINIYAGILINDFNDYISTLIMPSILATNVMVNAFIFHLLYTSGRYNVEE